MGIFLPFLQVSSQDYFQQEVNYKIQVTLNDRNHELSGYETVEYINNSRDTLKYLFFHLWPNAYSDNNTELAKEMLSREGKGKLFNDPELRGYIDSLDFTAEGRKFNWTLLEGLPDICRINLNMPLNPGDTVIISTPFHVKIPKGVTSRLGHIDESYQISQWYPKPAVYDRLGWHQMPYLDQGEFYSEYGSFDVSITLPANYIVGATGNLQNVDELRILEKLASDTSWMKTPDFRGTEFPPSSGRLKTLRYKESRVHDFAWFADKRFRVLKGNVKLPGSGREVTTWAMFTSQEEHLWKNSIQYINSAIGSFSKWIGDYPYCSFTALQSALNSGAGMEYPGLTVIGLAGDSYLLDEVLAHEVSHMWFYSAIGSDERRDPFMDESLATAYEGRYMEERYPGKKLWEISFNNKKLAKFFHADEMPAQRIQELEWLIPARSNQEQTANLHSTDYSYDNYGSIVYFKGGQGFNYLRSYLGDPLFDTIMHDYYSTWKNRHPTPRDLRATFESGAGKELNWFFDDFLGTTQRLDYKMVRLDDQKILIKNRGEMTAPLLIAGMAGDSVVSETWEEGFSGKKWIDAPLGNLSGIKIDPGHRMTELFRLNNNIRTKGILKRADPVYTRFLFTLDDPDKRALTYMPVFNWTRTDGFMLGVALNNGIMIPRPVEFSVIPFYAFQKSGLNGYGKISFNSTPYDSFIRLAKFSLEGEKFGAPGNQDYHKIKIGLDLFFRPNSAVNPFRHQVYGHYLTASDLMDIESLTPARMKSYLQSGYILQRTGIINPFNIQLSLEIGESYQKTSLEINYRYSYSGEKRGLDARLFTGTMFRSDPKSPVYDFASSGRGGPELYLYQGIFPDRFTAFPETFWSRQMTISEGGLATPTSDTLGYSRMLFSLTLTSSLPAKISWIPVKPFATVLMNEFGGETPGSPILLFEAGIKAGIWDFFEVYFPLLVSGNISSMNGSAKERIRFVFTLDKLNSLLSR